MARHLRRSYPTEHEEQAAFCRWLDAKGIGYFAVPNGARVRPAQAKKLKAEGMTAGAPDLVIYADAKNGLGAKLMTDPRDRRAAQHARPDA
mgnify:CR=1 FL=1